MDWNSHLSVFLICFLWSCWKVKASLDDVCDQFIPSIYCNCRFKGEDASVVCYLTGNLSMHDDIWTSVGLVEGMTSLDINTMQNIKLDYIPIEALRNSKTLKTLEAKQLNLGVLKTEAVSELPELRELNLEGSEISELQPRAISNLPKLKTLALSENLIQEVLADSLVGLDELEKLFLDKNNISRVESCAFCNLQNLKVLELWGNQITDLTEYMFRGLRYLTRLDLYKNQIRILNDRIFHPMPKLVEIYLKDNLIVHIAPNAFQGLKHLQTLMLNSNRIKVLPDHVFSPLSNLRSLDLCSNEMETLPESVVENIAKIKEEHFTFSFREENPLKCGCSLNWVPSYLTSAKSHQFRKELSELQCAEGNKNLTVHLLKLDCDESTTPDKRQDVVQPELHQDTVESRPVNMIPYEIQGRKSKARTTTQVADDQPSLEEAEPKKKPAAQELEDKDSSALSLFSDVYVVTLTVFLLLGMPNWL